MLRYVPKGHIIGKDEVLSSILSDGTINSLFYRGFSERGLGARVPLTATYCQNFPETHGENTGKTFPLCSIISMGRKACTRGGYVSPVVRLSYREGSVSGHASLLDGASPTPIRPTAGWPPP